MLARVNKSVKLRLVDEFRTLEWGRIEIEVGKLSFG